MSSRLKSIWPPVLFTIVILAAWQFFVVARDIKPFLLPAPTLIWENFSKDFGQMTSTALYTATTAILGLIFGTIVGVVMALLAQRFVVVHRITTPLAAGLAAVPIVALTPILNNMFDITSRTPRVLVTMIIVFFPIYVNMIRGLVQVQPVQLELMRSLSASPRRILRLLRIPNAIPFFFTAMKVAAPMAVITALVAEYFGGPQLGLGARIASSAANTAYGRAWAYVLASIIVGLVFYLVVLAAERWAAPWTGRSRSA